MAGDLIALGHQQGWMKVGFGATGLGLVDRLSPPAQLVLPFLLGRQRQGGVVGLLMNEVECRSASAAIRAAEFHGHVAESIREIVALEKPPHGGRCENPLPAATATGELERIVMRGGIEKVAHRVDEVTHGSSRSENESLARCSKYVPTAMSMTLLREQLVRKALAALSEIADECGDQPARKSLSLRFLLMYTFAESGADPKLKWIWDSFWTEATTPQSDRAQDAYIRGTNARSALAGICREVGYPPMSSFCGTWSGSGNV